MLENRFQKNLIKELRDLFPGCMILKNDPNYIQGIPDLSIFYGDKWAMLECKKGPNETKQPNQEYYISQLSRMSFAAIIYPENKEVVLSELQRTFGSDR